MLRAFDAGVKSQKRRMERNRYFGPFGTAREEDRFDEVRSVNVTGWLTPHAACAARRPDLRRSATQDYEARGRRSIAVAPRPSGQRAAPDSRKSPGLYDEHNRRAADRGFPPIAGSVRRVSHAWRCSIPAGNDGRGNGSG